MAANLSIKHELSGEEKNRREYWKQVTSHLLFGSNGIVASYIALSSYQIVFLRTGLGSIFLMLVFWLSKGKMTFWKSGMHSVYLVISGVAMGTAWILLFEAYQQIGVSIATLAYYCAPIIIMVLSPIFFKERITLSTGLGLLSVVLGMCLLNSESFRRSEISWGLVYGILSAVMYAVMVISNKKATKITGLENSMLQLIVSFIAVSGYVLYKDGILFSISKQDVLPIFFLGIVNTGVGCYFYFSSIKHLPASTVAICGYLDPLTAIILSVLILKEELMFIQIIGAVLILGGAVIGDYKRYMRPRIGALENN